MDGNVYLDGATASTNESNPTVEPNFDPMIRLEQRHHDFHLQLRFDEVWDQERTRKLVTSELLGKATIPDLPYEQPDGGSIRINTDYFGKSRNEANPTPGPFENPGTGLVTLKVWQ
jgi:alpha-N-arabinofuranosidase